MHVPFRSEHLTAKLGYGLDVSRGEDDVVEVFVVSNTPDVVSQIGDHQVYGRSKAFTAVKLLLLDMHTEFGLVE